MKNAKLLKLTNRALSGLLVLLGFNSCSKDDDNGGSGGPICMYGVPYAQYTIKGKVQNVPGTSIPGVRVISTQQDQWARKDTLLTNANGEFIFTYYPGEVEQTYKLLFRDIDGATNGSYKEDSVSVSFKAEDLKGKDGWLQGEATKEVKISLKENAK